MVGLEKLADAAEIAEVRELIQKHQNYTGSGLAAKILGAWDETVPKFVKVMPKDYKRALVQARERAAAKAVAAE
jgi:glutamate synthase (ferredoxin)